MFYKIVVLESFAKFTGKPLCWGNFLIKLQERGDFITIIFFTITILITVPNQAMLQLKQISKLT